MYINMMVKCGVFLVFMFYDCLMWSQISEINGMVSDGNSNKGLEYVQVVFVSEKGEKIEIFTDEIGSFSSMFPVGQYTLVIDEFGYEKYTQSFFLNDSLVDLGIISLNKVKELAIKKIIVSGKKVNIINQIDKKVIKLDDSPLSSFQDLAQIMNVMPGVNIDSDNQLSLRGSENVQVLINGRPSSLPFNQIVKLYPPDMISKIEVFTNPPAKYSVEGKGGAINIVLKKDTKKGTNFNLNTSYIYGKKSRHISGVDFNQGFKKFNIFGNAGYNDISWESSGNIYRPEINTLQIHKNQGNPITRYLKGGVDYFINDKNLFSIYTYQLGDNSNMLTDAIVVKNDSVIKINQDQKNNYKFQEYDIFYSSKFSELGEKLDVQYNFNKSIENIHRTSTNFNIEYEKQKEQNYRGNLDYIKPFIENSELQAGMEIRINEFTSNCNAEVENYFKFSRGIFSMYTEYNKQWERLALKAGIRGEYSDTRTKTDFVNFKGIHYYKFEYYPILNLSYKTGEEKKSTFYINYSRRIDRPWVGLFSPVPRLTIGEVLISGNEFIKPELTNIYEVGYSNKISKLYLGLSIFYRDIKNKISSRFIEHTSYVELINENIKKNDQYGAELNINYKPFKWWEIGSGFETYFGKGSSYFGDELYRRNLNYSFIKFNNSFNLEKSFHLMILGQFNSRKKEIQGDLKQSWKIDIALKKSIMDNQLSFGLSILDIFNTNHSEFNFTKPVSIQGRSDWESRKISFSIKYIFSSGKVKKAIRKSKVNDTVKGQGVL